MEQLHLGNTQDKLGTDNKEPHKVHDTVHHSLCIIQNDQKCVADEEKTAAYMLVDTQCLIFVQDENISQVISQYHS